MKTTRCFKPKGFGEIKNIHRHIFSDGSRVGYGAVAYLRLENNDGRVYCSFVLGRARLAPIREITTPKLELSAAVVSVQLRQTIKEEPEYKVDCTKFWTNSLSVLKCIRNENKRFHTFESNRLTIIRNGSSVFEWRYVPSEKNPADIASKGSKMDKDVGKRQWFEGPGFLWTDEDSWPAMIDLPPLSTEDPEVRRENRIYVAMSDEDLLQILF